MSLLLSTAHPRARIDHRCDTCGRTVHCGEIYSRAFLIGECGPYLWKECGHCEAFVALYLDQFAPWADDDEGYDGDCIRDWEPTTPLAIEHQRQWRAQWRDDTGALAGALVPVPNASREGTGDGS